jgi:hypothetical protein
MVTFRLSFKDPTKRITFELATTTPRGAGAHLGCRQKSQELQR